jgi:pimeloyl-ACP methyl ester carboxylesterase/DNA-binding CsgD family transcriptional regulator
MPSVNNAGVNAPPIQYARTSDGISIAYCTHGEGKAVVFMPTIPFRHVGLLWAISPGDRRQAHALASAGRRWVMFDPRGMGSSGPVDTFSLDGFVTDLEAVADELGLNEFALMATTYSNPIAVEYAVKHPDRISHLILTYPFLRSAEALRTPVLKSIKALRGHDWGVYTEASVHLIYGHARAEMSQILSRVLKEGITPERAWQVFELIDHFDMTEQAKRLKVPTLVIGERNRSVAVEHSRAVAAVIPSAQFVLPETNEESLLAAARFLGLLPGDAPALAPPVADTKSAVSLTPRELEVLALVVAGQSNRKIAEGLVLSERTVARHIANIYEKTAMHGRAEITAYALRHRLA